MAIPAELLALISPILISAGILLSSRAIISIGAGFMPLSGGVLLVGSSLLFGSFSVAFYLITACICTAGLTREILSRRKRRALETKAN